MIYNRNVTQTTIQIDQNKPTKMVGVKSGAPEM